MAFQKHLPRGDDDTGFEAPAEAAPVERGNGETILIGEGESTLLDQLDGFLGELGYKTLRASSPAANAAKIRAVLDDAGQEGTRDDG